MLEIRNDGPASQSRNRHNINAMTFTSNADGACYPVEIIQLRSRHFDGTQSEVVEAAKNRIVASANSVITPARRQHRPTLGWRKRLRERCQTPRRKPRKPLAQHLGVGVRQRFEMQISADRPIDDGSRSRCAVGGVAGEKALQFLVRQSIHTNRAAAKALQQKSPHSTAGDLACRLRQAADMLLILRECLQLARHSGRICRLLRSNKLLAAQEP